MNFSDLLAVHGLRAGDFRLVRHGTMELDPLLTFKEDPDLFVAYQAFQIAGKFGDAQYLAAFAPHHGNQALFLGIWRIDGEISALQAPAELIERVEHFGWPLNSMSYYILSDVYPLSDLSQRLIIDWGGSTVSWVQRLTDKPVVAILPPAHIQEFQSFEHVVLDRAALEMMVSNPTGNITWYNALRSVNGIYCITDMHTGRLYVGSAYGKNGIWARWADYVATGHGGNQLLMKLLSEFPDAAKQFQYSILEILPGSCTASDAVYKEQLWKRKLGSREHGYNEN